MPFTEDKSGHAALYQHREITDDACAGVGADIRPWDTKKKMMLETVLPERGRDCKMEESRAGTGRTFPAVLLQECGELRKRKACGPECITERNAARRYRRCMPGRLSRVRADRERSTEMIQEQALNQYLLIHQP